MKLNNKRAKRRIIIESLVFFSIAVSPILFKLHELFPKDPNDTIEILNFTIDRNGFYDLSTYFWFLLSKFIPLYLLIIWFLTCKHWWYHIIIIPISMYVFQIFEVVFSQDNLIDTDNLLWILPICLITISFVYFVRLKLYDKFVHGIDLEAIDEELKKSKRKDDELSN